MSARVQPDPSKACVVGLLESICDPAARIVMVVHEGEPIPLARARVGRRGGYNPARTEAALEALAWSLRAALPGPPVKGPVSLAAIFHWESSHEADVDNLLKLVMDAAQRAQVYVNDRQVVTVAALKAPAHGRPRTVIGFAVPAVEVEDGHALRAASGGAAA